MIAEVSGMVVEAPASVKAEVFHKAMSSGRNEPVLLGCRTSKGAMVDCVVKLAERLGGRAPLPYLAEWCAVAFGRLLGINVPEPFEVQITAPFAESLEGKWRDIAMKSLGSAFGSGLCTGGFVPWTSRTTIPPDLREAALALIAFDVLIHNPDRRTSNPNLLASREAFLAFDHDDAFSFVFPIVGNPDPAEDPIFGIVDQHALAQGLGRKIPSIDRFRRAVQAITDDQIAAIGRAAPSAWQDHTADGKLAKILDVMRRRRDAIEKWLPMVEARIQR